MSTTIASAPPSHAGLPRMSKGRAICLFGGIGVLSMTAMVMMSLAAILTLFQSRRFCSEVLGKWLGGAILRVSGIHLEIHGVSPPPQQQTIYLTNHTSTVDVFVLLALGLPRTRFFLWG